MAYKVDSGFYIGREDIHHITDFLVADNLYLILELKNGHNRESVGEIIRKFKNEIIFKTDLSLDELKEIVKNTFDSISNKENYSLAIVLFIDNVSYLLTRGEGEIYLYRHDKYVKIIHGDTEASGYCELDDMFMLSSKSFSNIVDNKALENALILKDPKTIIGELTPDLKEKEDAGAISLLIYLKEKNEEDEVESLEISQGEKSWQEEQNSKEISPIAKSENIYSKLRERMSYYHQNFSHNKRSTFIVLIILLVMLIWSVGSGSQRQLEKKLNDSLKTYQQRIDDKLDEANEIGSLNPDKATSLVTDAKTIFNELKQIVGDKKTDEMKLISSSIANAEKTVLKKEDKNYQEFYDFNLIKKEIKFQGGVSVDKDQAVLLNKEDGEVYYLSLSKKSVNTVKKEEIKKATYFSSYNNNLFIYSVNDGIYKIDAEEKVSLVIKKDEEWGTIGGMIVFNGNIYLLDKSKDNIYKYLVAENGFSDKNIYFKSGEEVKLSSLVNYSIDANIYILTENGIYKYLSGVRDEFSYSLPESDNDYQKIYANIDNDKVYLLEKERGKVYIMDKKGKYEKQIGSSIFSKAGDIFVSEDQGNIYILVNDKIYTVSL